MSGEEIQNEVTPEALEAEAKSMGWVPEDQFKGNKDHWVDAEEFVERGRKVLPILIANNKRQARELLSRDQKIDTLAQQLTNATTAIEKLEKHYTEANKRAVQNAKDSLKAELKQAREDGDVDAEERILGEIGDIQHREREAAKEPEKKIEAPKTPEIPDDMKQWYRENSWFGSPKPEDMKKSKAIARIAEDMRDEGNELVGVEFMNEALRIYEEQVGEPTRQPSQKVETPNPRGGGRASSKSFASLPKEAKDACLADAEDLVGPGKRFKTLDDWKTNYAKIYYGDDES
jgi:hypothetical protein